MKDTKLLIKTLVTQGCLLSPFFFLLAIVWVLSTTTVQRQNGIQWNLNGDGWDTL